MSSDDSVSLTEHSFVKTEVFVFKFRQHGKDHVLNVPVQIPLETTVKELAYRIINCHSISCYVEDDLELALERFVAAKRKDLRNQLDHAVIKSIKEAPDSVAEIVDSWKKAYSKEYVKYQDQDDKNGDEIEFANIYHALIHSPALDTLLQLEHSYSVAVKDLCEQRDMALEKLQKRHETDMESLIRSIGVSATDADVNNLSSRQLEEHQIQETYWSSTLSDLQEIQKREYREWVTTVYENMVSKENLHSKEIYENIIRQPIAPGQADRNMDYHIVQEDTVKMEESFTIHLGHQMKTMHNIRMICGDILSLCRHTTTFVGGNLVPQPQRLQTAMSLYSQSLSALVLLVDDRIQSQIGIKKEFRKQCMQSTEFHFTDFEKQLCSIENVLTKRPNRTRTVRTTSVLQRAGFDQSASSPATTTNLLQTGDFYVTRHSNLAQVHVVFHLVTDESVVNTNITSRHPIVIGLRNILLSAATHNITTLTIPLLLVHEMTENITIQWCMKRAELILKCVKGFMMEGLCWDGDDSRTIQFIVPEVL
ncbi:protein C12orf4 homolog [Rhopilema esculentum]|uniref:protein C12orf4 homolog n=1 Tax=Rhopilema esculentum TaxID=499914 RepID=UPI0031D9293E